MKKMSLYTLALLCFMPYLALRAEDDCDCLPPTEYVMEFLAESSTLFKGSDDWKEAIKKNRAQAHTIMASKRTHDDTGFPFREHYRGIAAYLYSLSHFRNAWHPMDDAVSGKFEITNNNGMIKIVAVLKNTEVITLNKDQLEEAQESAKKISGKPSRKEDSSGTECTHVPHMTYDEKTNKWMMNIESRCVVKMPLARCLAALEAAKK